MLEKLGNSFDVPIGEADIDVPEVGGKLGQFPRYVQPGSIPFDKPPRRKAMPEVLEARSATIAPVLRRCPQTGRAGHSCKHATGRTSIQPHAAFADEECLTQPL